VTAGLPVRERALGILERVDRKRETLDAVLAAELEAATPLSRADRNLLYALVYGVLRRRRNLDRTIRHFLRNPEQRIDRTATNILRMGIFQLRFLDRIPDSAAVNTSVELARKHAPAHLTGFVNGILRNAARNPDAPPPPEGGEPVARLAESASFPDWMIARWVERFGPAETERFCDALNAPAPLTLRVNPLRADRNELARRLADAAESVSLAPLSPDGLHLIGPRRSVAELPGFEDGAFQVQDEGAQLVVRHLAARPGHRVLDACAGLGGKTGGLAARMENRGEILALDLHARKLEKLGEEMGRLGVEIVRTAVGDLDRPVPELDREGFDRILLDAPCSGLGVIRRNPDAKWTIEARDLARFQARQLAFLERLAPALKSDGRLGYSVCTLEPEETDAVVGLFLARHPDFEVDPDPDGLPPSAAGLLSSDGFLRLLPHRHGTDGFFSVRFRRRG
jgi:16S rRNA (cytosine967-C5)-methyltransferase